MADIGVDDLFVPVCVIMRWTASPQAVATSVPDASLAGPGLTVQPHRAVVRDRDIGQRAPPDTDRAGGCVMLRHDVFATRGGAGGHGLGPDAGRQAGGERFTTVLAGIAPAVDTCVSRFTFDIQAGKALTYAVDADLSLAGAVHVRAVGGIAISRSAGFSRGTLNVDAASLEALFFHTNFAIARAGLRLTVDRVAMPVGATLSGRTFDTNATRLPAILFNTNLAKPRTCPPVAIFQVAVPLKADLPLGAAHISASQLDASPIHALQGPRTVRVVVAVSICCVRSA